MATLSKKIRNQIKNAGLPSGGQVPFQPKLTKNRRGKTIIQKKAAKYSPKKNKKGYVDQNGRIWIRDPAHGIYPAHWDVQEDDGRDYLRVDDSGNII